MNPNNDTILDEIIFSLPQSENWTIRHAVEGVQIFGGIGSGKSSGSGYKIARQYLEKGFGGLVLTAKVDEVDVWKQYCNNTNRTKDLVIIEPKGKFYFNVLEYEMNRDDEGKGLTANIVQLFRTVINAGRTMSNGSRSSDPFWDDALDIFLYSVIDLCILAYGKQISIDKIYAVATSIPNSIDELFADKAYEKSEFTNVMVNIIQSKFQTGKMKPEDKILYARLEDYFLNRHIPLAEKTRSIIEYSLDSFLFPLTRDPVYSLFCDKGSNISPEKCFTDGKIILLNLPVKKFDKVGREVQIMFKYIWQTAMERRNTEIHPKPVFLWADEAQNFIHEHDMVFQSTARSARVATTYITQNLPNYLANMGGDMAKSHIEAFLGTLGTKIFHANSDVVTNKYASELFGNTLLDIDKESKTINSTDLTINYSSELRDRPFVPPEKFIQLKTGTAENDFIVEAIMHLHRRLVRDINSFKPYIRVNFKQQ